MTLVSAVITTHKRKPKMVERALKSILNQTYSDIEIFVVDDSPNDYEYREDVAKMVRSYAEQNVNYIAHEAVKGACAARNSGLARAQGEFIGFLDDDDEWLPNKIEEQLKAFTDENIGFVYCSNLLYYEDKKTEIKVKTCKAEGYIFEQLILGNFVGSTSFPLLRTSMLREIGGFDEKVPSAQDWDVWLRMSQRYKVAFVDKPLVRYYSHSGEQITNSIEKKLLGWSMVEEKHREYLCSHRKARGVRLLRKSVIYAKGKQKSKAWKTWIAGVTTYPFAIRTILSAFKNILIQK